jgi:hypothetical protein
MNEQTRRGAFKLTAAAGLIGALNLLPEAGAADDRAVDDQLKTDRGFVLGSGMTEAEADCWELAARTAGKYFALPELHPMDRQEIAAAIHVIQYKLLSRPTYRRYLELAKKSTPPKKAVQKQRE